MLPLFLIDQLIPLFLTKKFQILQFAEFLNGSINNFKR